MTEQDLNAIMELNAIIAAIKQQREAAMDALAHNAGVVAKLQQRINELEEQLRSRDE